MCGRINSAYWLQEGCLSMCGCNIFLMEGGCLMMFFAFPDLTLFSNKCFVNACVLVSSNRPGSLMTDGRPVFFICGRILFSSQLEEDVL